MPRVLLPLVLVFFTTACATSPAWRKQLLAPTSLQGFSAVYSEFDMHLELVTEADAPACREVECAADRAFDRRIFTLGQRLANVAFRQHAALHLRFPRFEFIIADKADAGSASSAGGTVMIFRGVRRLELGEAALAFILAREMGHVIGGHHDENFTASILATVAASSVLPTSAMASVASFAGSRALRASYRPQQLREAEAIAMQLLATAGWNDRQVSDQLAALCPALTGEAAWTSELRESARRIAALMQGPLLPDDPDGAGAAAGQIGPKLPDPPPAAVSKPF